MFLPVNSEIGYDCYLSGGGTKLYSVSQKSSPPPKKKKLFCNMFTSDQLVQLKITLFIAQTYSYVLVHLSESELYHFY